MNVSKAIFSGPRLVLGVGLAVLGSVVLPLVGAVLRSASRAPGRPAANPPEAAPERASAAPPAAEPPPSAPEPRAPARGYLGPEHIPV